MTLSNYFALNVDPSQALPETYNYGLVLLSYLVAVLGSYAFLQFATRIAELREAGLRYSWLVIGAIAMGGGIWAMHFIGMLAHILPIPVSYDPWTTALSIVPAILGAGVALHVVARPAITTSRLLIGGTLMGAGIGAMHYTGMMAMQLNALVRYDPTLFAASIVVAVLLAVLALQVRQVISKLNLIRFGIVRDGVGALIMGFAVTAMHYTAMASTYCFATPGPHRTPVDHSVFAGVTALIASLVLLLTIVAVMFDRRVAQETSSHRRTSEQLLQAHLAIAQGEAAQILAVGEQQIEGKEDELFRLPFGQGGLQGGEVGRTMRIERHRLAVDHAIGQLLGLFGGRLELLRPVQALARAQARLAVLDPQLQAIAVELDLVRPARLRRRALNQLAELRLDESRYLADLARLGLSFGEGCLVAAALLGALPDRTGRASLAGHERRRRPPGADGDLLKGPAGGDGCRILLEDGILVALARRLVV